MPTEQKSVKEIFGAALEPAGLPGWSALPACRWLPLAASASGHCAGCAVRDMRVWRESACSAKLRHRLLATIRVENKERESRKMKASPRHRRQRAYPTQPSRTALLEFSAVTEFEYQAANASASSRQQGRRRIQERVGDGNVVQQVEACGMREQQQSEVAHHHSRLRQKPFDEMEVANVVCGLVIARQEIHRHPGRTPP